MIQMQFLNFLTSFISIGSSQKEPSIIIPFLIIIRSPYYNLLDVLQNTKVTENISMKHSEITFYVK